MPTLSGHPTPRHPDRPRHTAGNRLTVLLALVAALPAASLAAQDPGEWKPSTAPWVNNFYPFFPSLGNNYPLIALRLEQRKAADYFARVPYAGLASIEVGTGFTGARMAVGRFQAPLLRRDWRLAATLGTTRETRLGYFGLGNATAYHSGFEADSQGKYYRARRTRYFGSLELSRRITGPVFLAAAGGFDRSNLGDVANPSLFRTDYGATDLTDSDLNGRVTLVLDWRNNEFDPKRGLLAQASVGGGTGGSGYRRISGDLRIYVPVREGTTFAARATGTALTTGAPLNARYTMPVWEGEIPVLGGTASHRGLKFQRLAGRGALFASAEVRHDLLSLGDLGAFTLIGFVDAGRVFEPEEFTLTTRDMKVGGGGGLAIRLLRFTIWTFNFAGGPDGFQFSSGTGWSF